MQLDPKDPKPEPEPEGDLDALLMEAMRMAQEED